MIDAGIVTLMMYMQILGSPSTALVTPNDLPGKWTNDNCYK